MSIELGMTAYIFEHNDKIGAEKIGYIRYAVKTYGHAKFLESQPQLFEFVPCNKKGEVIKYPKVDRVPSKININLITPTKELLEFQQALDRVLWKDWKLEGYSDTSGNIATVWLEDGSDSSCDDLKASNIERLKDRLSKTTYGKLITDGVRLERIEKK